MPKLNRRRALAIVASLPALATPAVAATAHPDAALIALGNQLEAAQQAVAAICDQHSRLHRQYDEAVPPPAACRWQPADEKLLGLVQKDHYRDDGLILPHAIKRLRELGPERETWDVQHLPGGDIKIIRSMRPNDLARAREILQAYEAWHTRDQTLQNQLGMETWDDETYAAMDAEDAVIEQIKATPAHTINGLKVKARAAQACMVDEHDRAFDIVHELARAVLALGSTA